MNHFSADFIKKSIACAVRAGLQRKKGKICDLEGGQLFSDRFECPLAS